MSHRRCVPAAYESWSLAAATSTRSRSTPFADPSPPIIEPADLGRDLAGDWRQIVAQLRETSPQEALDQVYRRVMIHLCNGCFREWIENPAG